MDLWSRIADALPPGPGDASAAAALLEEVRAGGPLARTQTSLLRLADAAAARFYAALEDVRSPRSPAAAEPDSSWMLRSDFCFVNVRATAHDGCLGTFLQAAKLLPAMAVDAVHLAPFHPVHFDVVYAPEDQETVDPALADPRLVAAGIGPADQLRAFVEACHLLGKAVGYDLLPHVTQFGRLVVERPELFRWIKLNPARTELACADPGRPYGRAERLDASSAVAAIASVVKREHGLPSLVPHPDADAAAVLASDRAYFSTIRACIEAGLWPVLAHSWNGAGVPAFRGYDRAGNYPLFAYRDESGADASAYAYGVVTPYAFYDGVPPNAPPDPADPPALNRDAVERYAHAFDPWRDGFGFDFVRFDSVDHVFDSIMDDEGRVPLSDRPTPEVLRTATAAVRGRTAAGTMAERLGTDIEEYSEAGFDLVMGNDMMRRVDAPLLRDGFALYDRLLAWNAAAKALGRTPPRRPVSACFAVDTHDTGSPALWGSPLAVVMGPDRMRLRHAASRFLSVGPGRRPKYEVMGFQDLSTGLYEANVACKGLRWADDARFAAGYAAIERLYARLRPFMDAGEMAERRVEPSWAGWLVRGSGRTRLLAVFMSLETADGRAPGLVELPVARDWGRLEGTLYRLPDDVGVTAEAEGSVRATLGYLDCVVLDLAPVFY